MRAGMTRPTYLRVVRGDEDPPLPGAVISATCQGEQCVSPGVEWSSLLLWNCSCGARLCLDCFEEHAARGHKEK